MKDPIFTLLDKNNIVPDYWPQDIENIYFIHGHRLDTKDSADMNDYNYINVKNDLSKNKEQTSILRINKNRHAYNIDGGVKDHEQSNKVPRLCGLCLEQLAADMNHPEHSIYEVEYIHGKANITSYIMPINKNDISYNYKQFRIINNNLTCI